MFIPNQILHYGFFIVGLAGMIHSGLALLWSLIATLRQSEADLANQREICGWAMLFATSLAAFIFRP